MMDCDVQPRRPRTIALYRLLKSRNYFDKLQSFERMRNAM